MLLTLRFTCWALFIGEYRMSSFLGLSSGLVEDLSVSTCKVFACVVEAEWREEGYRPQHLVCTLSFNPLAGSTVPLPLPVLMFPSPKSKILVYLPRCKSACCLSLWN